MSPKSQKNLTLIGAIIIIALQGAMIGFDMQIKGASRNLHLAASIIISVALLGLVFKNDP